MTLCLVTDRRRLGAAIGARPGELSEVLQQQVILAAAAGVDFIQVREPDMDAGALTLLVRALVRSTRAYQAKILVNDRLDVALAAGADGVHLKETSIAPAVVRRLVAPGFVIGRSIHGTGALSAAIGADFLVAGTVLPTISKPETSLLGLDGLRSVVQGAAPVPVFAIGGIESSSLAEVASTGVSGVAAIGAFIPGRGAGQLPEFMQKRVAELRFGFDS